MVLLKLMLGAWLVLHISLLVMNSFSKTEFVIFISLIFSLLPKDLTIQKELKYRNAHLSH